MQAVQRIAPVVAAIGALSPALAGAADAGRVLLKPPATIVASPITDRFAVRAHYAGLAVDNTLRYDSSAGVAGTPIDVEDVLGQSDQSRQGSLDLMLRIGARNRIEADFFQLRRTGNEVMAAPLRFGDDVHAAGERLVSEMELRKLGLAWTFSLLRRERIEVGAGLAVHLVQLDGRLTNPLTFVSERLDTAGPFAALAGNATWRITRRFSLSLAGQYFDLSPDDVRGAYRHFRGDLQYRPWRNLAFGVGYTYSGYLVDSTDAEFSGNYRLVYQGPEAFLRVSF